MSQTLQSEAPGPHPDGLGLFAAILGGSLGKELSFDTLTLSLLVKIRILCIFFLVYCGLKVKVSNESSWPTDQPRIGGKCPRPSG